MRWRDETIEALRRSAYGRRIVGRGQILINKGRAVVPGKLPAWRPSYLFVPPSLLWFAVFLFVALGIEWPIWLVAGWAPQWSFLLFGLIFPAIALWWGAYQCRSTTTGDGLAIGFGGLFFIVLMLFTGFVPIG